MYKVHARGCMKMYHWSKHTDYNPIYRNNMKTKLYGNSSTEYFKFQEKCIFQIAQVKEISNLYFF